MRLQLVPALFLAIFLQFITKPQPQFSFYGTNWVLDILAIIWLVLIFIPKRAANNKLTLPHKL